MILTTLLPLITLLPLTSLIISNICILSDSTKFVTEIGSYTSTIISNNCTSVISPTAKSANKASLFITECISNNYTTQTAFTELEIKTRIEEVKNLATSFFYYYYPFWYRRIYINTINTINTLNTA